MAVDLGGKAMKGRKSDLWHLCGGILLSSVPLSLAFALVSATDQAGRTPESKQVAVSDARNELTVALREIPVWEVHQRVRGSFLYGQISPTFAQRDPHIPCPPLTSSAPPYGLARFADAIVRPNGGPDSTGGVLPFVLDQSETGAGRYDVLYFDENVDRDLTNDEPRRPLKDVPAGLIAQDGRAVERTWFEPVQVTIRSPRIDRRTIELLPCVWKYENESPIVRFVPAKAYTGRFEIDGKSYEAFLGYESTVSASLDEPSSALHLIAPDGRPVGYLGVEKLSTTQWIDGKYYRFSCTPTGDKLFVHPYAGPLGVLELGAGRREVKELQMMGELSTPEGVVGIGYPLDEKGMPRGTARCEIPVGDYYPRYMSVCARPGSPSRTTTTLPRRAGPYGQSPHLRHQDQPRQALRARLLEQAGRSPGPASSVSPPGHPAPDRGGAGDPASTS
jgi:hypothetical protein